MAEPGIEQLRTEALDVAFIEVLEFLSLPHLRRQTLNHGIRRKSVTGGDFAQNIGRLRVLHRDYGFVE